MAEGEAGGKIVTVQMTGELVEQLGEWSPPVQVKVTRTPGFDPEYTAVARTCEVPAWADIAGFRVRLFHSDGSNNWQTFRPEDVEIIRVDK